MNPYDFVRLVGNGPRREAVQQHHQYQGLAGQITCQFSLRTPLFIPTYRSGGADHTKVHETLKMNYDRENHALIPGTSLKGVIRSVAEAVANGCFSLPRRYSYERQTVQYKIPPGFRACDDIEKLCPACRLFGMLNQGSVFAGNVSIQDAVSLQANPPIQEFILAVLGAPKPRHKPFYTKQPNEREPLIRGRKFYFHNPKGVHRRPDLVKDSQNKTVVAVIPPAQFRFTVDYANLSQSDLDLLLFSLTLWEDTCHKVGMGKSIGLGSVKMETIELRRLDYSARYSRLGGGWEEPLTGASLQDMIARQTSAYLSGSGDNLLDLHRILRWDEDAPGTAYPTRDWFNNNPNTPLEGAL